MIANISFALLNSGEYLYLGKILKLLVHFLTKNGATLYVHWCAATFLFFLNYTKESIAQKTVGCVAYKTLIKHAVLRHCEIICCVL